MGKTAKGAPTQTILDFKDGKPKTLPLQDDDIGGELLPILSKGLYTNPLDCIREYVQNGVDAGASEIKIKITGNSVIIFDNGSGMNMEELIHSRRFGVSPKTPEENAGFRGIGIYSGYDLSNRLVMTTKKAGDAKVNTMRFDFRGMKKELESVRKERGDNKIPLNKLLFEYTTFSQERDSNTKPNYTIVQLEDISDTHIFRLSNRAELRNYILQNLPVDFDAAFEYRDEIIDNLSTHVPGFKAVRIILQSDDADDEVVAKPSICNLQRPVFNYIKNSEKQNIAYYWSCLNKQRGRIEEEYNSCPVSDSQSLTTTSKIDPSEYQGFLYKCKSFTVGNRQKLRSMFTAGSGTLYHWYTGEIYVLDPKVIPNAERYDFETSPAKTSLEIAVREALQGLEQEAEKYRSKGLADEKIEKRSAEFETLQINFENKKVDPSTAILELDQIIKEVKKHKTKASADKKETAQALITNAERLQKQIRHDIDRYSTTSGAGSSSGTSSSTSRNNPTQKPKPDDGRATAAGSYSQTEPTKEKTLTDVIREIDFSSVEDFKTIVTILDSVIVDLIGAHSSHYRSIVNEVEARLQSELVED